MSGRTTAGAAARRTATAHARVAAALRRKADACVGVAKALRFVAGEVRAETGDAAARELEARWALQLAETQDREGETCAREAASADSRALRASMRAKHRR